MAAHVPASATVSANNLSMRRAIVFAALLKAFAEIRAARPMIFVAAARKQSPPVSSLRRRRGFGSGPGVRRVAAAATAFHTAHNLPGVPRGLVSRAVPPVAQVLSFSLAPSIVSVEHPARHRHGAGVADDEDAT
jgi:hypothetical protein